MIIPPSTRKYVRVSVNVPQVSGAFDYHLPEGMQQEVQPGCLLEVPFGSQLVQGIVLELIDHPAVEETKPIHHLVDADPVVTADQLRLAAWMEHNSLNTLSQCVDQMLLPGLSKQAEVVFTPTGQEIPGQLETNSIAYPPTGEPARQPPDTATGCGLPPGGLAFGCPQPCAAGISHHPVAPYPAFPPSKIGQADPTGSQGGRYILHR